MQSNEPEEEQKQQVQKINDTKLVLLSKSELKWLLGDIKVSKSFEYKIKSRIKRKIQTLTELELPLLVKKNFFVNDDDYGYRYETEDDDDNSLGKAKVLGPNPSQGCFCLSKIPRFLLIHGYKPSQTLTKYSKGLTKYDKIEVRNNYG
jgi:hypothetical protein